MTLRLPLSCTNNRLSRYYKALAKPRHLSAARAAQCPKHTFFSSGCAGAMVKNVRWIKGARATVLAEGWAEASKARPLPFFWFLAFYPGDHVPIR